MRYSDFCPCPTAPPLVTVATTSPPPVTDRAADFACISSYTNLRLEPVLEEEASHYSQLLQATPGTAASGREHGASQSEPNRLGGGRLRDIRRYALFPLWGLDPRSPDRLQNPSPMTSVAAFLWDGCRRHECGAQNLIQACFNPHPHTLSPSAFGRKSGRIRNIYLCNYQMTPGQRNTGLLATR